MSIYFISLSSALFSLIFLILYYFILFYLFQLIFLILFNFILFISINFSYSILFYLFLLIFLILFYLFLLIFLILFYFVPTGNLNVLSKNYAKIWIFLVPTVMSRTYVRTQVLWKENGYQILCTVWLACMKIEQHYILLRM